MTIMYFDGDKVVREWVGADKLGMFIQPDWWEVTQAGVGTNRYSYSFNDPVTPNAVEAAISRLRRKLEDTGVAGALHTVRGVGYMLKDGKA